jgi:hypothetical protein
MSPSSEPAGLAEEARRLVDALEDKLPGWLREHADRHPDLSAESLNTGAPECRLCPLCRMVGLLRDREDAQGLLDALGNVSAAVLGLLDSVLDDRRRQGGSRSESPVEHIDIG